MTDKYRSDTICMIAYANYYTDARIKNYVDALLRNGYQVDVFALGLPEPTRPGLRVFSLMSKVWSKKLLPYVLSQMWFLFRASFQVGVQFVSRRYVMVHVHNMPDFIVFAAFIPKMFGVKVILDIHDTMPEFYATKFDLPLDHLMIRLITMEERLSAVFANHIITTNLLHKESLVEHGIPAEKISIVMNLGNPAIFYPQMHNKKPVGLTISYHGTVAARLGLDMILEAIQRARPRCPGINFVLIGDGEFMPDVRRLVTDYALQDVVQLIGWMPVESLPEYLSNIDIGIIGIRSQYEKSRNWALPVKMLEYAAMEIPVIAPRLRVIRHYFDETSSFYYTPDDTEDMMQRMIEISQHPERIDEAKKHLREFNKKYNWSITERQYLSTVADLVAQE
jgi:glycosyltransferase involved in cell wall biosynthesis